MDADLRVLVAIVSSLGLAVAIHALRVTRRPRRAVMRRMAAGLAPLVGNRLTRFVRAYVPLVVFLAWLSLLGIATSIQGHAAGAVGSAGVVGMLLLAVNILVTGHSAWTMQVPRRFRGMTESELVEWFENGS